MRGGPPSHAVLFLSTNKSSENNRHVPYLNEIDTLQ